MKQDEVFQQFEADNYFLRNQGKSALEPKDDIVTYILDLYHLVNSNSSVLEVGAANGYRLAQLHQKTGCKVYGVEPSAVAVADAKQRFPFIEFSCTTAAEMEFSQQFDILILHGVFCWIDRTTLLNSIFKIDQYLKYGGYLIVGDFQLPYFVKNKYHHLQNQQVFTYKQRYKELFLQTGGYLELCYLCYNHDQMMSFKDINLSNMFCVSLLRKEDLYLDQSQLGF